MITVVVHLAALCFLVPGLRALFQPRADAWRLDQRRLSLQAKIEHRAIKGGEAIAAACLLEVAVWAEWPKEIRGGIHLALAVALLGNCLARGLSFFLDVQEGLPGWPSIFRLLGALGTATLLILSAPMLPGATLDQLVPPAADAAAVGAP